MTTKNRYTSSLGCVYDIGYHIIWCTKYRRKALTEDVIPRLKELLLKKASEIDVTIEEMEAMSDHVHLFVKAKPTLAVHFIVNQFKGYTSSILRKEFSKVKSILPSLWTRSYFVASVGFISKDTVIKYIENQKHV